MRIKGVLFDLDGTLLDTEPSYDLVEQKLVNEYGNGQHISWEIRQRLLGTTPLVNAQILIDKYEIKLTPKDFLKIRDKLLIEPFSKCQFKKGARETTHKCKYELGLKCAIATESSLHNFEVKTNHLKDWLNEDIDIVVTSDDKRIKEGKPAPDIFILAAKELGLEPNECIVFEDAPSGVQAACSAGAKIVVAVMEKWQRNTLDGIIYDKNITKLIVLDSMDQFDFSLVKSTE
jgi:pseudouridine-5'-monophosphatase